MSLRVRVIMSIGIFFEVFRCNLFACSHLGQKVYPRGTVGPCGGCTVPVDEKHVDTHVANACRGMGLFNTAVDLRRAGHKSCLCWNGILMSVPLFPY